MAPILNFHPGSLPSFALRLKQDDNLDSLRSRAAKKVRLQLSDGIPLVLKYRHEHEVYTLEDADDYDIFLERFGNAKEADLYLESPEIPSRSAADHDHSDDDAAPDVVPNVPVVDESTLVHRTHGRGKSGAVSIHRVTPNAVTSLDEFTDAGGVSGGGRDSILYPPPREPAPAPGFSKPVVPELPTSQSFNDAASFKTGKSKKTTQTAASATPSHKIAFQEFHSQLGVRLLKGSLGPVQDVPMMLKSGYRHVYVSRSFALTHGFIPKDTTPGTYGFNGITNLGKWPVQVGSKAVPCTVMLAEDSYFPVILGRSFMEKRGVRTDPIDMTSVTFMDNGERADVEVVVVRDEHGEPVPIP
ncbi:hypothetical protein IE53DRAFT_383089 [Violaceomyces palustris]|uniref:Uncharacterized protein n=1 Tax=Violaceomyces palustris TaxID=1673888 RepID=A0ACD0P8D6_9BASI|nr:hypothetical protein IE53DRAFT_383089 [Violaceomyces palustris]